MPFWRKLHIKATESQDLNDMPDDFTRLLWVMLPLGLGKEGRGIDNPGWVKAKVMPLRTDEITEAVSDAMNWYADHGMIIRYEVNGRKYFYIPTWHDHQNTNKEGVDNYPPPNEFIPTSDKVRSKSRQSQDKVKTKLGGNGGVKGDSNSTSNSISSSDSSSQPFGQLVDAFIKTSGIPSFGNVPRDVKAGQRMVDKGVTVEDVIEGTQQLLDKEMTVVSLASVEKASYIAMGRRKKPPKTKTSALDELREELANGNA